MLGETAGADKSPSPFADRMVLVRPYGLAEEEWDSSSNVGPCGQEGLLTA